MVGSQLMVPSTRTAVTSFTDVDEQALNKTALLR